jgi:hypothetical protein
MADEEKKWSNRAGPETDLSEAHIEWALQQIRAMRERAEEIATGEIQDAIKADTASREQWRRQADEMASQLGIPCDGPVKMPFENPDIIAVTRDIARGVPEK